MIDPIFIEAAKLGLAAFIVVIVLIWKHQDDQQHYNEMKAIIVRLEARDDRTLQIVEANTKALVALQATIEALASIERIEERLRELGHERKR